jgi:cytochrome P450 family 307 subfamily A
MVGYVAQVGARIQAEISQVSGERRAVNLFDRAAMPYTEATILETLRVTSSPIVPHVATQDSSIGGYDVPKGTVVFLNNLELNTGAAYWSEPHNFSPERFIVNEQVVKPAHFIPFSTGQNKPQLFTAHAHF